MAQGLLAHLGREVDLPEVLGVRWTLARLDLAVWRKFFEWAKTVLPEPLKVAHAHVTKLAEEEYQLMLQYRALPEEAPDRARLQHMIETNQAEQKHTAHVGIDKATSYLSFGSPEATSLINSVEGATRIYMHLLEKHQPGVTEEDAYMVVVALGEGNVQKFLDLAGGVTPPESAKNAPAPAA